MKNHSPGFARLSDGGGHIVDCSCGWRDSAVWSFENGAVQSFVEHVLEDVMEDINDLEVLDYPYIASLFVEVDSE